MWISELELTGIESNIWKIYLLKALHGFFVSIPVIVLFWKANGLSMFQVMILQAIFAVSVILLEVPSGYFADRFGRRNTLLIASVFGTLGILGYSLGHNFQQFLLGETLWAISVSLISGADAAMFYDTLKEIGKEGSYQEMWGKTQFYFMISAGIASVLGGFIAEYNLRWTLFTQLPFLAATIPLAYSLKEPEHFEDVAEEEKESLKTVITKISKRKDLRMLLVYGGFVYAALQTAFWFYQPYFELSGLDVMMFGILFASFNFISAAGSKYAYKVEEKLGKALSLVLLSVLIVVSLSLMSSFVLYFSFVFIFLQQLVRGFSKPVISDYINNLVSSENRGTILSTKSLIGRFLQSISMPIFGLIADFYSLTQTLSLLGITVILTATVLIGVLKWEGVIEI